MASLREAAEELSKRSRQDRELEEKFEDIEKVEKGSVVKEERLRHEINAEEPGKVAGVDGGILKKRYSAADIVAVRAVAAVFRFKGMELENADYLPGKSEEPEFYVFDPQDQEGMERKAEAERLKAETSVALEALKGSYTVFMDGSVVPSYSQDEEVIERYGELYRESGDGNLVGVVEDSNGLSLAELLEQKTGVEIGNMRDTRIMASILSEGERSFVRKYSKGPAEHPVIKKMDREHANRLHTFYIKLSKKDLPLRIDYYGKSGDADRLAGQLMALKSSERYTVPSPVLEADRRAKIPQKYLKRLEKRFSPEEKRRNRRSIS